MRDAPSERPAGLLIRAIGDETVVYDLERHHAHCLNRTAVAVFRLADGRRSPAEIAALLGGRPATPADEETVRVAFGMLAGAGLLDGGCARVEVSPGPAVTGRREALRRVGLGAALLAPAVASLLVPTPASAAATCIQQAACTAAKYGQPCYVLSTAECSSKICIDNNTCY